MISDVLHCLVRERNIFSAFFFGRTHHNSYELSGAKYFARRWLLLLWLNSFVIPAIHHRWLLLLAAQWWFNWFKLILTPVAITKSSRCTIFLLKNKGTTTNYIYNNRRPKKKLPSASRLTDTLLWRHLDPILTRFDDLAGQNNKKVVVH